MFTPTFWGGSEVYPWETSEDIILGDFGIQSVLYLEDWSVCSHMKLIEAKEGDMNIHKPSAAAAAVVNIDSQLKNDK